VVQKESKRWFSSRRSREGGVGKVLRVHAGQLKGVGSVRVVPLIVKERRDARRTLGVSAGTLSTKRQEAWERLSTRRREKDKRSGLLGCRERFVLSMDARQNPSIQRSKGPGNQ